MSTHEKRALELIERAKKELELEEETLCSDDRPQTASEWMAWLLDHVVEDMHYCIQQETSLKWTYGAMRLIERLEILEITPSSNMRFWQHHPEVLNSQEASLDNRSDVVGYLLQEEFICRECVEDEFTGDMEAFWADQPVPLTIEDVLLLGKPLCATCVEQKEQIIPSEIIILQPRQEKREDAFWYSGEVARTEKYVLFAIEEIACRFQEENNPDGSDMFHDEEAREEARDRNLTDGDFVDHVHWYRNNWFEIRDMQNNQITDVTPETWTEGVNTLIDLISHDEEDKNDI